MKIVHTGDWHIGKIVNEFSMLNQQRFCLQQLYDYLKKHQIDVLVIAGDLYDRTLPSQESIQIVNEILSKIILELKIVVLVIAGNHDSIQMIEYGSSLFTNQQLYIEGTTKDVIKKVNVGDLDFYLLPFITPFQYSHQFKQENIKTFQDLAIYQMEQIRKQFDPNHKQVLITHGYLTSGSFIPEKSDSMRPLSLGTIDTVDISVFDSFDLILAGHIHKPMNIANKAYYSGALYKYSKSEVNYPVGFNVITYENQQFSIERHLFNLDLDMRVIKGYFEDTMKGTSQDYIFFELEDKNRILDGMKLLQQHYPHACGLEYINLNPTNPMTISQSSLHQKGTLELFGEFYESILNRPLNDEELAFLKEISQEREHQ